MAVPLVISFTLRFLFATVDLVYAALLEDDSAVAAISFYIPFQGVYIALWVGLSAGFTASLASAFGNRDEQRIHALKSTMLRIQRTLIPVLLALGVVLWSVIPQFGLEPELTRSFRIYGTTLLVGLPLTGFWSIYPDSIVKVHYDTRSTMIAGMLGTAANIALNTVFVFVFHWGIFGIAFATVLSRLAARGSAMRRATYHEARRHAEEGWDDPTERTWPGPLRTILKLSVPAGLTFGLTAAEGTVINKLLDDVPESTVAIASYGVYHQLSMLALMPTIAVSVAVLPYVARMVPEGHGERVRRELRATLTMVAGFALLFTIPAGWLFAPQLAGFFVAQGTGDATNPLTLEVLRLLPFGALASLPFLMLRPVFEAMHEPRTGIAVSIARFVVFSIPLVLTGRYAATGLGYQPLTGMVTGLIAASLCASLMTAILTARLLSRAARSRADA